VPDASRAVVAVVDGGVAAHPDLSRPQIPPDGNQCPGPNTDMDGHGTKVAGVIGGKRNGTFAVGVAWSAGLRAYKFLCPSGFLAKRAADAFVAATKASPLPDVVNASWVQFPEPSRGEERHLVDDDAIAKIDQAIMANPGVLFVFSAPPGKGPYPPFASRPNVLVVTASDQSEKVPRWAGRNPSAVHLAAPGVEIATADISPPGAPPAGTVFQGSSAAAAFVSGCAALVKLASPATLTGAAIAKQIVDNADRQTTLAKDVIDGRRLNCGKAVSTVPGKR